MPQFHETGYGKRFFDHQLPQLIDAIRELGQQVARQNVLMEETLSRQDAVGPETLEIDSDLNLRPANLTKLSMRLNNIFNGENPIEGVMTGDPLFIEAKGITGFDVVQGWYVTRHQDNPDMIKVEFNKDGDPQAEMIQRWVPYDCVTRDPHRKNRHCTE